MPALSGALTILLAQAGGICGADAVPTATPPRPATIEQREDGFVIAIPEVAGRPADATPLRLGRTIRIDETLLASTSGQGGKTSR